MRTARRGGWVLNVALQERVRAADIVTIQILYSGSVLEAAIDTHSPTEALAVCANDHDGTCTAILSRGNAESDQLTASLVCESCGEVVKILGFVEHTLGGLPSLTLSQDLNKAA